MTWLRYILLAFVVASATVLLMFLLYHPAARRASAGMLLTADVYVWQRAWTDSVRTAVAEHGGAFHRVIVLSRQIDWTDGEPRVVRVVADWDALRQTRAAIGAAVRIGVFAGNFESTAGRVSGVLDELIEEASQHGITLAEVQIDFDAASSKLSGYQTWLEACQKNPQHIPVTITALPSWLGAPGFAALAKTAAGSPAGAPYVLQVHGLEKPRTATDVMALCDPVAACKAVEKAARIGAPFRVALPTYGYAVAFDDAGKFAGMSAEGAPDGWAAGKEVRLVESQPAELADLVHTWSADGGRPAAMTGIIWYRLPVATDQFNWRWPTLAAVMVGQNPQAGKLVADIHPTGDGVREVLLTNVGALDVGGTMRVVVRWGGTGTVVADALGAFELSRETTAGAPASAENREPVQQLNFTSLGDWNARLRPGEQRVIGWLRFTSPASGEQEIHGYVEDPTKNIGNQRGGRTSGAAGGPGL